MKVAGWGGRKDFSGGSKRRTTETTRRREHQREHERGEGKNNQKMWTPASWLEVRSNIHVFTLLHSACFKVGVFIFVPSSNVFRQHAPIPRGANV